MAAPSINLLYNEMRQMHREIHELRAALIPEEEITPAERRELHAILDEMRQGKEKDWRKIRA